MPCTQYSYMFSHLERLAREVKIFQVILFMIRSRIIIDWCVTVSWIPDGTTSLGYEPAYACSTGRLIVFGLTTLIYWNRLIIWPIIYNLSLMSLSFVSLFSLSFPSLYLAPSLSLSFLPSSSLFLNLSPLPSFFLPPESMEKQQKPELPSSLQSERWACADSTPLESHSIISGFWGLCGMHCPWDTVTEMTDNSHKFGPPKNRAATRWLSAHCALLPIREDAFMHWGQQKVPAHYLPASK